MSSDLRISPRERLVLITIIESYITTGEPVASQTVARQFADKDGMSSATIRNVMASLSDAGLLDQPHTSAGRIPTAKAFRFYVEQLSGASRQLPLAQERREQIDDNFTGVSSSQQFLERTSHVLALISSGVGVALASTSRSPCAGAYPLHAAHGWTGSRGCRDQGRPRHGPDADARSRSDARGIEASARFLNENFHGWSIDRIRTELTGPDGAGTQRVRPLNAVGK